MPRRWAATLDSKAGSHLMAEAIEVAAFATERFLERVRDAVAAWPIPAESVWLFGSAARAEATDDSDIDILVVRPSAMEGDDVEWDHQLASFAGGIRAMSGNACEILDYTRDELIGLNDAGDPLMRAVLADAVVVTGRRPSALIAASV